MKLLLPLYIFLSLGCNQSATNQKIAPKMVQPASNFYFPCSTSNCKNMLVIGDSISLGYLASLANKIKQEYTVSHPEENCRNTWYTLQNIDKWLGAGDKPDVIIWNNGIWNVVREELSNQPGQTKEQYGTTLEQYESDIRQIAYKMQKTGARVIFLTTTALDSAKTENYFDTQKINQLNQVAFKVMQELNIDIYDLNAVSLTIQNELVDGIHYTQAGSGVLANFITLSIK